MNLQQTYLIECNRSNSTVLSQNENYNSIFTSDITPFNLKRGDQVSVSSVAIESEGIGSPDVIEFTRTNPQIDGKQKLDIKKSNIINIRFMKRENFMWRFVLVEIHEGFDTACKYRRSLHRSSYSHDMFQNMLDDL